MKLFVCDLVTCVLNWGKPIVDVWFVRRWSYVVDGTNQLIAPVLPLVCVCSVQASIYALGKAHMRSTPSLRSFPNVAFEMFPVFV